MTLLITNRDLHASLTGRGSHATLNRLLRPLIIILTLAITLPAAADDFAKAKLAFDFGQYKTAVLLLRPLAEKGDPRPQHLLAECYFRKHGVSVGFKEALNWLERAVARRYLPAYSRLGMELLKLNRGRHERGLRLIRTASARGDPAAQVTFGNLYFRGIGGVPLDLERSKELFLKAAGHKHMGGIYFLIIWYGSNEGKKSDSVEMLRWVIIGTRIGSRIRTHLDIGEAMMFFRQMALKKLTKSQIAEAERRASVWLMAHGENP